ncbi:MAG: hypothetical protein ACOVMP_08035 [Chthoniobacterales bacterium]
MLRNAACFVGLILLVGCGDVRRNETETLIRNSTPEGLVVKKIDPRFVIKQLPNGTHSADVPVYYQVSGDRYDIRRLLSTAQGKLLAVEIDSVASWATSVLRQNDPTREQIIAIRAEIETDTLLLNRVMGDGDEVASIVQVAWTPDPQIIAGLPEVRGQLVSDPDLGILAGSPAASAAFDAIRSSLDSMEMLRARWISTRDLRTETDQKRWTEIFVSGAVFVDPDHRLIVAQGFDVTSQPRGVLTSTTIPVRTRALSAKLEPVYAGGMLLRVVEANEISPEDPAAIARTRPIPNASNATLQITDARTLVLTTPEGKRLTLKFDQIVDVLPPEPE